MGFKVDELFVDFSVEFGSLDADARKVEASLGKMSRAAGVAADAADTLDRAHKRGAASVRRLGKETEEGGRAYRTLATGVRQAAADFKAGIITAEDYRTALSHARAEALRLRVAGLQPTGNELTAFNAVLRTSAEAQRGAGRGFGRMTNALTSVGIAAAGLPGPLGRVASLLLGFAVGGGVTVAVVAGFAAIAFAVEKLTRRNRDARKEVAELIKELAALDPALTGTLRAARTLAEVRAEQRRLADELDRARRGRIVDRPGAIGSERVVDEGKVQQLTQQLKEANAAIRAALAGERKAIEEVSEARRKDIMEVVAQAGLMREAVALRLFEQADLGRITALRDQATKKLAEQNLELEDELALLKAITELDFAALELWLRTLKGVVGQGQADPTGFAKVAAAARATARDLTLMERSLRRIEEIRKQSAAGMKQNIDKFVLEILERRREFDALLDTFLQISDALGIMDDDTRRLAGSVIDLVQALRQVETLKLLQQTTGEKQSTFMPTLTAVAAIAGVIGTFLGMLGASGRITRQNTEAIERLRRSFDEARAALSQFSGTEFGQAQSLVDRALGMPASPFPIDYRKFFSPADVELLNSVAESLGLTFRGTRADFLLLRDAIATLELGRLVETFGGALDLLQRRFELFDIENPVQQLEEFLQIIPDSFSKWVKTIDVSTAEGRADLQRWIREIFTAIQTGQFDLSMLGGLTVDEVLDVLQDIKGFLDDIEENAADTAGATTNFIHESRVTEIQGNRLINLVDTGVELQRMQLTELQDIHGVLTARLNPPSAAAIATVGSMSQGTAISTSLTVGSISVHLPAVGETDPRALARTIAPLIVDEIDRELQVREISKARARGTG